MTATIPMTKIVSSNIAAIGHDAAKNELHVRFSSGVTYVYSDVHRVFYQNMLAAKSAGSYHAEHIKGVFKHRKL
jgi:hypothetical protein